MRSQILSKIMIKNKTMNRGGSTIPEIHFVMVRLTTYFQTKQLKWISRRGVTGKIVNKTEERVVMFSLKRRLHVDQ